ncbi:uncharacterized protein LOC107999844 isoform X2 [Apis cerana]|uniref:uncharacterized protein LOC107999844 isoform X2 n=1 Tax=Apis cerana TaxID=7461 RepID=UPI002B222DBA|nr:uncharacterized protein LOC107999844 isoform X2 [Apis cerana]
MTTFPRGMNRRIFLSLCAIFLSFVPVSIAHNDRADVAAAAAVSASPEDARPYRFAFNVVDFQHRFENKVKNAQGILKNRAKGGRKLVEAIARACGACRRIALGMDKAGDVHGATRNKIASAAKPSTSDPLLERVRGALMEKKRDDGSPREWSFKDARGLRRGKGLAVRNVIDHATRNSTKGEKKLIPRERNNSPEVNDQVHGRTANDVRYRFNYTISSQGHQEDGYVSGKKDYAARNETRVNYLPNEFGHRPNVSSFVNATNDESQRELKGSFFLRY